MWIAVWITMLNALSSSGGFINAARLSVAEGVPVGVLDITIGLGFLWAVFQGGTIHSRYPRQHMHPLIPWLMGLWGIAFLCGTIGSLGGLAASREVLQSMRDFALVPVCIFIGYRMLATPRS